MQKDLFGNGMDVKYEEKIFFNFKNNQFDEDFLPLKDLENIIKNVNLIVKGSLEELNKEEQIAKNDFQIKANVKKGSLIFEILVPYVIPILSDPNNLNAIQILFDWLKNKWFDKLKEKNTSDFSAMHNKNINNGTCNIVNNYYENCTINNYDNSKQIAFSNEEDKNNILENLKNETEEKVKKEKHIGTVIQANKKESKDIFQPKNSTQKIKIEFPNISQSEKIDIFNKDEIEFMGNTYYKQEKVIKIVVIEIIET